MDLSRVLYFMHLFSGPVESFLVNIENNTVQPELKKLIDQVSNAEIKAFLLGLDVALDAFIKAEIGKV